MFNKCESKTFHFVNYFSSLINIVVTFMVFAFFFCNVICHLCSICNWNNMVMSTSNNKITSLVLISSENLFSVVTQSKGLSIFLIIDKAKLKVVSTWIELLRRIRNTLFRRWWETLHHTSSWLNTDGAWIQSFVLGTKSTFKLAQAHTTVYRKTKWSAEKC